MTAVDLLIALVEAGCVLWADGARLRYRAPVGAVDDVLRAGVARCRPAVVALVRAGAVLPVDVGAWPYAARVELEERVGMMQFDGGMPREIAEREAERCVRVGFVRAWVERRALVVAPSDVNAVATVHVRGTARTGR